MEASSGERPTVVCVVGGPRSGTSLTMRILNLLGVYIGPQSALKPAGPANPTGFWEHMEIKRLNDDLLRRDDSTRLEPAARREGWGESEELAPARARAREVLAATFAGHELWGWKDTSNSLALPFWQGLMPELRYVVCVRNPVDLAASLERSVRPRPGDVAASWASAERVFDAWPGYVASILTTTSGSPRVLVAYEDWHDDWQGTAARLARLIGRDPPGPDDAATRAIRELIDDGLRHHRTADADVLSNDRVPLSTASLYTAVKLLHGVAPERDDDPVHRELHAAVDLYAERLL